MRKSESQIKQFKFFGMRNLIAANTGCSNDYVGRVLNGTVARNGKKALLILEWAENLRLAMEMMESAVGSQQSVVGSKKQTLVTMFPKTRYQNGSVAARK